MVIRVDKMGGTVSGCVMCAECMIEEVVAISKEEVGIR